MIINQKGFTLIELMVALVILTILMGFAIPEVLNQINLSKFETQKANIKEIQRAINQHYADRGIYPAQLEDLIKTEGVIKVNVDENRTDLQDYIDKNKLVKSGGNYYKKKDYAPYFTIIPADPVAGNSYWEIGVKWVEKSPPPGQD
ncbi:MAG TPA: prepilin-type N-terminal cleavage/methylation domain-containing protein, partial [Candidatus Wallbacteria bacterium]|nr:prepilin-type N-terminal cleavage/methylation domain-containing protein [Candidatus Wallbacteria bacterium]